MLGRLRPYLLRLMIMDLDGACMFRALAYALWGSSRDHYRLRLQIASEILRDPARYSELIQNEFPDVASIHDYVLWL